MNICIFYYDGFCEFEVAIAAGLFSENLITAALEDKIYISEEHQQFVPHKGINELNPADIDLFIIPGGDPSYLYENETLKNFINELNKNGRYIAAICGGTELLAAYGILENKRCTGDSSGIKLTAESAAIFKNSLIVNEAVVVDGNIITSMGRAFIEFAFKLAVLLKKYQNEEDASADYKWYKNIRD